MNLELLGPIEIDGVPCTTFRIPSYDSPAAIDRIGDAAITLHKDLGLPNGDGGRSWLCSLCPNYPKSRKTCSQGGYGTACPVDTQTGIIETKYVPILLMRMA